MTTKKVTKRDSLNAILTVLEALDISSALPEGITATDIADYATNEITLLDNKAAKAKARAESKRAEGDELQAKIKGVLTADEFKTLNDIVAAVGDEDLTPAKATPRLKNLVDNGEVEKSDVTIPAGDGTKKRVVKGYRLIAG